MSLLFFILGLFLGSGLGVFIMCLMFVSGREAELERMRELNDEADKV